MYEMKKWLLLAVMALFVAVPVVAWAGTLSPGRPFAGYLYDAGQLLALVGFVFLTFQYVLSSKIKWIERGLGLDKMLALHRTCGIVGAGLILAHPLTTSAAELFLYKRVYLTPIKLVGVAALSLLSLGAGVALLYPRSDWKYETWKRLHWVNYLVLPIGLWHSLRLGGDLALQPLRSFWFGLGAIYVGVTAHKLWRLVQVRTHPFDVTAVVQETPDTCSVYLKGKPIQYKPGQFLTIQLARNGRVSESHPFTIAASPGEDRLAISVKSLGDFTSTIPDTTSSDRAYIDAPYGVFSYLNHDAPNLVFIAGGIGITPFMSMLRDLRDKGLERNVLLIWANKTERDIAFRAELKEMASDMASLRVVHVLSRQQDWPGERGYVDADLLQRYLAEMRDPQVFLCGPPAMTKGVLRALHALGIPRSRIHYEQFALR
jgi:predicted ferric reductase